MLTSRISSYRGSDIILRVRPARKPGASVMTKSVRQLSLVVLIAGCFVGVIVRAQQQGGLSVAEKQRRWDVEKELQSIATIERKVMMPMPDGIHLATDIYRPKNAGPSSKVPIVFVRT